MGAILDKASLVITPNAIKESKLYSVVPSDGSGDLSVVRATTATRVNSAGLIEDAPYNLLQRSEEFNNVYWVETASTVTSNTSTSPKGTLTADTLVVSTNGYLVTELANYVVVVGQSVTVSIFIKSQTLNILAFGGGTPAGNDVYSIEDYGNGWYRHIRTRTFTTSAVSTVQFIIAVVGTYIIWGAQLVKGSIAKEYFPTTDRLNVPRLDYTNSTCPSILVEPQRTNVITYSEDYANASWTKERLTIANSSVLSPNGVSFSKKIVETLELGHKVIYKNVFLAATKTFSIYAKKGEREYMSISIDASTTIYFVYTFDLNNGTMVKSANTAGSVTSYEVTQLSDGWFKYSVTVTSLGSIPSSTGFRVSLNTNSNPTYSDYGLQQYQGDPTKGIYLWGSQMEAGANATSYIPAVAASVTRNADVISKTGISSLINSSEGCLFVECSVLSEAITNSLSFSVSDGTGNNYMYFRITPNTKALAVLAAVGGVLQVVMTNTTVFNLTNTFKVAIKWKLNDYSLWFNGVKIASDNIASVWSTGVLNTFSFNAGFSNVNPFEGKVKQVNIYKTALTDAECIALTTL